MGIGGNKFNQWVQGEINSISGYRGKYFQSVGIGGNIFNSWIREKNSNHWLGGEYIQSLDG